ncbi:MAG: hypothetical protein ACTSRK_14515, partial [Promethearchaeota archaeon]
MKKQIKKIKLWLTILAMVSSIIVSANTSTDFINDPNELNVNTIAPKIPFSSEIHDPIYISGNIELANFIANEG